jgi:SAM-dependent methyltransferase
MNDEPDVHYSPTPAEVVDLMLQLAQVGPGDLVYDLGCGDGRIVIAAAQKYGASGIGFDLDAELVKQARANVAKAGVQGRVAIQHANIFALDLSPASVVTLYLLTALNQRLIPQLKKLRPGARIVSHQFELKRCKPRQVVHLRECEGHRDLYLWVAPLGEE